MNRKAVHSVMPKTLYYRTDGTGRDMYIAYDNGGAFQPLNNLRSYEKIVIRPKTAASKSSVKSLHYVPDGSGRDSYIKITDGGLHSASSFRHSLVNFKSSLRDYQPLKVSCDPYTWTQSNWKTSKSRLCSRNDSKKIQKCINRLYKLD
jgi:hypothetical protein